MKNIYLAIAEKQNALSGLVLATVTENKGSTPQKPGSSAIFDHNGLVTGTVGGGVVEGRVTEFAMNSFRTRRSGYLHISLDNETTEVEEAICGGQISILVDAHPDKHLTVWKGISESIASREPGLLITKITTDKAGYISMDRFWMTIRNADLFPFNETKFFNTDLRSLIGNLQSTDYKLINISASAEHPAAALFLEPIFPQPRLVIAGAGHIGKAVSHLSKLLDFDVMVIDDRDEYANIKNLPDAGQIIVKDIGTAMNDLEIASDTYILIVTRGHKDDTAALRPCIGAPAAYVGMIGSKSKVARMHSEFIEKGWATEEQWDKIYTPVGLDIKSKTVEEIAVSIAAQLILVKNNRL